MSTQKSSARRTTVAEYQALAAFRHALRRFLEFSTAAARSAGLPPQQHQALLAIKGFPGRHPVSVGELAVQLCVRPHSAVGFVDRLVRQALVRRVPSRDDHRRVQVRLTARGEALLARLSAAHRDELRRVGPELRQALEKIASHGI
ncbi:MAG TPA: MarR family transcriptional regulator [Opitutaceae bacterium]|nr:MarR family transcriptional regulator [Opitutaceae bacterium]